MFISRAERALLVGDTDAFDKAIVKLLDKQIEQKLIRLLTEQLKAGMRRTVSDIDAKNFL